jgi:hypothetical protein
MLETRLKRSGRVRGIRQSLSSWRCLRLDVLIGKVCNLNSASAVPRDLGVDATHHAQWRNRFAAVVGKRIPNSGRPALRQLLGIGDFELVKGVHFPGLISDIKPQCVICRRITTTAKGKEDFPPVR